MKTIILYFCLFPCIVFGQMDMNKTENLEYLNRKKCKHCIIKTTTNEEGDTTELVTVYNKKNKKYRHGWAIFYHANGHILEKVKYKSNYITNGSDFIFNENGQLRVKSRHKNSVTQGKIYYYNAEDGSIRNHDIFRRGFNKKDLKTANGKRIFVIYTATKNPIRSFECNEIQQKYRVYHYNIAEIEDKQVKKIENRHNRFAFFRLRMINGKNWYEKFLKELKDCKEKHY